MPAVNYLIKSDHEVLNDWGQARRVEEHTRRQLAWRRQQERRLDGKEGMALRVRLKEASAAELEARMRAHKVGGAICLHLLGGARASFRMDACWAVGQANLAWPGLAAGIECRLRGGICTLPPVHLCPCWPLPSSCLSAATLTLCNPALASPPPSAAGQVFEGEAGRGMQQRGPAWGAAERCRSGAAGGGAAAPGQHAPA